VAADNDDARRTVTVTRRSPDHPRPCAERGTRRAADGRDPDSRDTGRPTPVYQAAAGGYLAAPLREPVIRESSLDSRAQVMVWSPSAQEASVGVRTVTSYMLFS